MGNTKKRNLRQEAIDWMNSKNRTFDQGLDILKSSKYKPHVAAYLEKYRNDRDVPGKLEVILRQYLRFTVNPDNAIHEDEDPDPGQTTDPETNLNKELEKEYPPVVKKLVKACGDLSNIRDKYHNRLKEIQDKKDDKSQEERAELGILLDAAGRILEPHLKAFHEYKTSGTLPDESVLAQTFDPDKVLKDAKEKEKKPDPSPKKDDPKTLEELTKEKDNLRTKITKARTRLEYQAENRKGEKNPMPKGPKRTELEKKIEKLEKEKAEIEQKIADLK